MDIRVAAYAIITDENNRLLLPHWQTGHYGGWTLPGGGIDPGEDPADGVIREIYEETGYTAELEQLLGIDSMVIPADRRIREEEQGTALQALRIVYRAQITGGELTVEQEGSTDDVGWFTPEEVEQLERVTLVDIGRRMAGLI
ncbi:NUDIX hydrolase [Nesterenkonia massiliensis]|uniref:NUDIX hydrolase n=3 Tax=Nesterenkonia TaxID=57494 RepID=A0ABT2HPX8_9MICC|nr:NUDIX hydrolase [Nesterenkonia massiliensis]MCT1606604.1 NUDIX hydrolase [Nesterenkonia massiliensis]